MGCVYMYVNKLNGKKYVGQTMRDIKIRHRQHLDQNDSYFDKELKKYGEQNFELIILEDNIFDENELFDKEMFYIKKYDTFLNGYNLTKGGKGASTFSENDGKEIIELLKSSNLTLLEIGNKFNYSLWTISEINQGNTFYQETEDYPIRKEPINKKFFINDIENVIDFLQNTNYSFNDIAEKTNTTFTFVCDVNRGKVNYNYTIPIPIRKYKYDKSNITLEICLQIVEYLKQDYSAEQIATIFDIPYYTVGQINRGKMAICKQINETFPIQKRPHRNKETAQELCATLSKQDVLNIVNLILNTSLSFEEIARRYNVHKTTIDRINRKQTWKNVLTEYEAPIRTNPKNKQ